MSKKLIQHIEQCHTYGNSLKNTCLIFRDLLVSLLLLVFPSIIHEVITGAGHPSSHWLNGCLLWFTDQHGLLLATLLDSHMISHDGASWQHQPSPQNQQQTRICGSCKSCVCCVFVKWVPCVFKWSSKWLKFNCFSILSNSCVVACPRHGPKWTHIMIVNE